MKVALVSLFLLTVLSACSSGGSGGGQTGDNLPVSIIAQNQGRLGSIVVLDGTQSNVTAGKSISYQWSFKSRPDGSAAVIDNVDNDVTFFISDVLGNYVVQLIVSDGTSSSSPTEFTFVINVNIAPVANPGTDKDIVLGATIQLDGSDSKDADGDSIALYQWEIMSRPIDSVAALNNTNIVTPSFYADVAGVYEIQLVVGDGEMLSGANSVTLTTTTTNSAPVAITNMSATIITGQSYSLNGAGSSDADGDSLFFQWVFKNIPVDSSVTTLNNAGSPSPSFTPDMDGQYDIELTVNDGTVDSLPVIASITSQTAAAGNTPPIADAGASTNVEINTSVALSGAMSSDLDGDTLEFSWRFVSKPLGSSTATLINLLPPNANFTPDTVGIYVVELIVNDGTINSNPTTVTITATDPNSPPIADAGADISVLLGSVVTLNGRGSSDPDTGDTITYKWNFVLRPLGSTVSLNDNDTTIDQPQFTPDKSGNYVARLIVNDGKVDSLPSLVTIFINSTPIAFAGDVIAATINTPVSLDGTGSMDPDGDPLTYQWVMSESVAPIKPTLSGATTATPSFTPIVAGSYAVQLTVNDGKIDSNVSTVRIEVNTLPVANAGSNQTVTVNSPVTLDGSSSSDSDSDPLTYQWVFISNPGANPPTLNNATPSAPTFTPVLEGDYVIQLIVNDGIANSLPVTITVTATGAVTPVQCSTLKPVFLTTTWTEIKNSCFSCHQIGSGGALNFVDEAITGFNDANFNMFRAISLNKDSSNQSLMLSKPRNTSTPVAHSGGQIYPTVTTPGYIILKNMVESVTTCIVDTGNSANIILNTRYERLRKNTLALASRLPTPAEETSINNASAATLELEMNAILDTLLTETAFYTRLKLIYNDLLLTNAFPGNTPLFRFDLNNFNNGRDDYFGKTNLVANGGYPSETDPDVNKIRSNAGYGLEQAPLELISYVVSKNFPFTEILTANYLMVNPYSAKILDLSLNGFEFTYQEDITTKANSKNNFIPVTLLTDRNGRSYPHAGLLTTIGFLTRYQTTATNLNRARSRVVYKYFLDLDVEGLADRAGLDLNNIIGAFPTLVDPQCTQCHITVDPIAGTFKNWDDKGQFLGNLATWPNTFVPPEILAPGFSTSVPLPAGQSATALQWLAGKIVADDRFAITVVKTMFTGFTGKQPTSNETALIQTLKTDFVNSNFNLKSLIKAILNTNTFRATNLNLNENPALFPDTGMGRLLTPEQFDSKIQAINAPAKYRWQSPSKRKLSDILAYNLLYGGIDSVEATKRITETTPIMNGIQMRVAMQTSCDTVAKDFKSPINNRYFFPFVEITDTPIIPAPAPANSQINDKVIQNIRHLHKLILGEVLVAGNSDDDIIITESFDFFTSVWDVTTDADFPAACLNSLATPVVNSKRTVQTWMAFVSYLLIDYKFLYE